MISIKFNGWFQCRQATDPDPADDPRGVSGRSLALPLEPDFDRIIKLQKADRIYCRTHTPEIGVTVKEVFDSTGKVNDHKFIGAEVRLDNNAIYKGLNEIVAPGGREPIVPFDLIMSNSRARIERSCPNKPEFRDFPYPALQSSGNMWALGRISESTGIFNIRRCMDLRICLLANDLRRARRANEYDTAANIIRRIRFLQTSKATFFFNMMLPYNIPLGDKAILSDPDKIFNDRIDENKEWIVDFWMGAWDSDANCGFMEGYLNIPEIK